MKFKTTLPPYSVGQKISLSHQILAIGSCFSDNIGKKLVENKFDTLVNPFGTLFDPLSIVRLLQYSVSNKLPHSDTYIESDGVFKNLELHSSLNGLSKDELELKIRASLATTSEFIRSAKWLIITLGTANLYRYKVTSSYIANCQKLPATNFTKELITSEHISKSFDELIRTLKEINPFLNVILAVSPVRHLKDGISQNNLSKSILRVACDNLTQKHAEVQYYPSYELMMDDLRDYRYYKEDMIHPTEQAIEYIWQHFANTFMDKEAFDFLEKWQKVSTSIQHRPFNPRTPEHQNFLRATMAELILLKDVVNIDKELSMLKERII